MRVQLGLGMPRDAIVPDRSFNTRQTTEAFLGYPAVASAEYDPLESPLRQSVTLGMLGPGGERLPPRRLELYYNALRSEDAPVGGAAQERAKYMGPDPGGPGDSFRTSELVRQVLLGVRQADVSDYEVMNEYTLEEVGTVRGRQRSALYLHPQQVQYFEAARRAAAVYDYEFVMHRVAAPEDAPPGAVACVDTPKEVAQCV